jgi:hypothetical protein
MNAATFKVSRKSEWRKQAKWNQEEHRRSTCEDVKCDEKILCATCDSE